MIQISRSKFVFFIQHRYWFIHTLGLIGLLILPRAYFIPLWAFLIFVTLYHGWQTWQGHRESDKRTATASPLFFSASSTKLLQQVLNDFPNRVYWRDQDLRFQGANHAFYRDLHLLNPDELYGTTDQNFPMLAKTPQFVERDKKAMLEKRPLSGREIMLPSKDKDNQRWVEHCAVPLKDEFGKVVGVIGSYYDISRVKSATTQLALAKDAAEASKEAAIRANQAKSNFLANMSHEIRTPINAIMGMASLLQKTELSEKQNRYTKTIHSSSQALLGVINDILDFSKIEANKLTVERIPFDLNEIFSTIADMFAYKCYDKGLEFIIHIPNNIPTQLVGDPLRLNQVLINLVSNAIKFTQEGEINISCTLLERQEDFVFIRISVTDTGIGLSEEQRANVFNAFTQADASTTRKHGGTGLGLAISKRLIDLMNGDIGMTSSVGQGSTFYVELALPIQEAQEGNLEHFIDELHHIKIIAVDDHLNTREMLYELLSSYQMRIKTSPTAEQAIDLIEQAIEEKDPYQLALIDWRLPGMGGLELVEKLQQRLAVQHLPEMILATGYYSEELADKAKAAGVYDFITKPYTGPSLIRSLYGALHQHPTHQVSEQPTGKVTKVPHDLWYAPLLLVEDNEINQHVAKEILESYGFSIDIAEHGLVAVDKIQGHDYALVLMDIQMPIMDGYEAVRIIRQTHSAQKLPILAMTANAMHDDVEKSNAVGMQGHITKPIDEHILINQIIKWALRGPYQAQASVLRKLESKQLAKQEKRYPKMKGIDLDAAMQRLGHNDQLYIQLVNQLTEQYKDAALTVSEWISHKQYDEARRYFHSLKGAAANLGLTRVHKTAMLLEEAVRDGEIHAVADHIPHIRKELENVTQAVFDLKLILEAQQTHKD